MSTLKARPFLSRQSARSAVVSQVWPASALLLSPEVCASGRVRPHTIKGFTRPRPFPSGTWKAWSGLVAQHCEAEKGACDGHPLRLVVVSPAILKSSAPPETNRSERYCSRLCQLHLIGTWAVCPAVSQPQETGLLEVFLQFVQDSWRRFIWGFSCW